MNSPAVAQAWEFWGRHRLGLCGVVALVAGFAVYCAVSPLPTNVASLNSMWFLMGLCYVIGVFAYGFEARLETPESGFPTRLFILPVQTWKLVGLPMLQGIAAAVLLWLVWDRLVLRPCGVETPAWWAAMLAAVVATSQAIVWFPFGLPWVRILVALVVLVALLQAPLFLGLVGVEFADPNTETTILSVLAAALIPVAYLVAVAGVSRARCGESPDWLRRWRSVRSSTRSHESAPFASAMRAQLWYEWRARGRMFVMTTGIVLAVLVAAALLLEPVDSNKTAFATVLQLMPILLASMYGSYAGTAGATGAEVRSAQLSAFAATRPLSNAAFVVAKFWATGVATLAAWAITLATTSAWLHYTGGFNNLGLAWDGFVVKYGQDKAIVGGLLLAIGSVLLTWRTLAVSLWPGLTGRSWVATVQPILTGLIVLQVMGEWVQWDADAARRERILEVLPWLAGTAVALKLLVGAWALRQLLRRDEVTPATATQLLAVWFVLTATLFGLLVWLVPEGLVPVYGLALGVVLAVPVARLALAPLAFAWNRHR